MIELWTCSRLEGRPRIRVETCAALHAKAEHARTRMQRIGLEPCIGCAGIVALNRAEQREPVAIDTSRYRPPRMLSASHDEDGQSYKNSQPVRHLRNDPVRVKMVVDGRLT